MENIKITLRKLRVELDITQKEMAKLLDIPLSTYRKKESGHSKLTLEEAIAISNIAKKTIEEIFLVS